MTVIKTLTVNVSTSSKISNVVTKPVNSAFLSKPKVTNVSISPRVVILPGLKYKTTVEINALKLDYQVLVKMFDHVINTQVSVVKGNRSVCHPTLIDDYVITGYVVLGYML